MHWWLAANRIRKKNSLIDLTLKEPPNKQRNPYRTLDENPHRTPPGRAVSSSVEC